MTSYPNPRSSTLFDSHRHILEVGSAIWREVYEESGVWTITHGRQLPRGFSDRQRKRGGGILFMGHRPNAKTFYVYRPDDPDPDNPGLKYEATCKKLGGPGNVLYVHPSTRQLIGNTSVPVIFVEGIKKALAIVTAARAAGVEVLVVAISGVWNWLSGGKPISDMFDIDVEGREVFIGFDSDVFSNPDVSDAARRIAAHLKDRGASVYLSYLPDGPDGSKTGADDYLAWGHSYREYMARMRLFDARDLQAERVSRNGKLQASDAYLWRAWHDCDWMNFKGTEDKGNWQRGHTARDVKAALNGLVLSVGKPDARGVVIEAGLRRISRLAAKSAPSVGDAMKHLEADGQIEILPATDKAKPRRYLLLVPSAALYSTEGHSAKETESGEGDPRCKGLRYPSASRLRWTSPARLGHLVRRVEGETGRTVTEAVGENVFVDSDYRPYAKRLGPHRGAVLDALEAAGGEMHLKDLCEALNRKRPWDVRRRILKPLEEAGIIECEGDVVRLAAGWLTRLDERREEDGEVEQAEKQAKRHRTEGERYRLHLQRQKHGTPKASLEAVRRTRELRERRMREAREEEERRRSPLGPDVLAFVADLVKRNGRIRMGLLCEIAHDEGHRSHDVSRAVEALGYRVERLPEYGDERFVFPPFEEVAGWRGIPGQPRRPPRHFVTLRTSTRSALAQRLCTSTRTPPTPPRWPGTGKRTSKPCGAT